MNSFNSDETKPLGKKLNYAKDGKEKFEIKKESGGVSLYQKSIEDQFGIKADPFTHPDGEWSGTPFHEHNNIDQPATEFKYLAGFIQTLPGNGPPTQIPKTIYDQICLIINMGTPELWIYDITNKTWRKFT